MSGPSALAVTQRPFRPKGAVSGFDTLHKWDMGSRSGLGSSPLESTSLQRLSNRNFKQLLQQEQFHNDEIRDKRSRQVSFIMQQQVKNTYLRLVFLHRDVARRLRPSVRVSITNVSLVKSALTPYNVYVIHVVTDNGWWKCGRRYSEWRQLKDCIHSTFGKLKLPEFPRRKMIFTSNDKIIEERKHMLQEYLRAILHSRAANEDFIWSFLGVPEIFQMVNKDSTALIQHRPVFGDIKEPVDDFEQHIHDVEGLSGHLWVGDSNEFLANAARLLEMATPLTEVTGFRAKRPLPPLIDFMTLVIVKSSLPFTTCITALILVDRLRQKGVVLKTSQHLLFVVSLIVASKYLHDMPDRPVCNNWFASKAIFALEFQLLRALNFELFVSTRHYNNFLSMVEEEWTNRIPTATGNDIAQVAGHRMSKSDTFVTITTTDNARRPDTAKSMPGTPRNGPTRNVVMDLDTEAEFVMCSIVNPN